MTVAELIVKLQTMPQHADITYMHNEIVTEVYEIRLYGEYDEDEGETTMFVCIE